jgi:hypothetical protein
MPKVAKSDELTRPEPRDRTESPQGEAAERGVRLLIVCFIAAVAIAMLLLDGPTTIAADDNDTPISKSASATGFAGHAWAR